MKAKYKLKLTIDSEIGVVELELSLHLRNTALRNKWTLATNPFNSQVDFGKCGQIPYLMHHETQISKIYDTSGQVPTHQK